MLFNKISKPLLKNPLVQRYAYSLMRPDTFWIYATVYFLIVVLLFFISYIIREYQNIFKSSSELYKAIYCQFLFLQTLVLLLWGLINSASAIREEVSEKTYDFFRILPLSAGQKAAGILIGKNLLVLAMAGVNFLFLIIFGFLATLSVTLQVEVIFALVSIAILVNLLGLLFFMQPVKKDNKIIRVFLIILGFFFGFPFFITLTETFRSIEKLENVHISFFRLRVPALLLIGVLALYFSGWAIKGILRKFNHEQETLFTSRAALLFMLGYEFVLFGLFYKYLFDTSYPAYTSYWLVSLIPVLLIPVSSMRIFDKYLEHSGLIRLRTKPNMIHVLFYSNLSGSLSLFAIWAGGAITATLIAGAPLSICLFLIAVLFSFYMFLILLLELYVVYIPIYNKMGFLLGFITSVYLILPLILSAILESKKVYLYSFFGFLGFLPRYEDAPSDARTLVGVCIMNIFLCAVSALLIKRRYNHILRLRQTMNSD